jgi:hypothetical protein
MIVLCANCHGRKGNAPGQIDRGSLRQYKANLAVINSRYGDLERRVLEYLAERRIELGPGRGGRPDVAPDRIRGVSVAVPGDMRLLMKYLIKDGYVELVSVGQRLFNPFAPPGSDWGQGPRFDTGVSPQTDHYRLTSLGVEFLDAWMSAQPIEGIDN